MYVISSLKTKLGFIALLLASTGLSAQILSSKQIDSVAEKTLKTFNVPGVAVAVVKDGKIIHSKGYGVRSLRTQQKVDENTLFGVASNSKAYTAAALGMLVDEKKITWDTKVTDSVLCIGLLPKHNFMVLFCSERNNNESLCFSNNIIYTNI